MTDINLNFFARYTSVKPDIFKFAHFCVQTESDNVSAKKYKNNLAPASIK